MSPNPNHSHQGNSPKPVRSLLMMSLIVCMLIFVLKVANPSTTTVPILPPQVSSDTTVRVNGGHPLPPTADVGKKEGGGPLPTPAPPITVPPPKALEVPPPTLPPPPAPTTTIEAAAPASDPDHPVKRDQRFYDVPAGGAGGEIGTLESEDSEQMPCERFTSCLTCLFTTKTERTNTSAEVVLPKLRNRCLWCAGVDACVDARVVTDTSKCTNRKTSSSGGRRRYILPTFKTDIEDRSCPAIMHDLVPANMRTINVPHKTGGPEALLQLYFALEKWGFRASLDSIALLPGGNVPGFFADKYREELLLQASLRPFPSHDVWQVSGIEGDLLISADYRACNMHSPTEIYGKPRQAVYAEAKQQEEALSKLMGIAEPSSPSSRTADGTPLIKQEPDPTYYIPADHSSSRQLRYMLADVRSGTWPYCSMVGHTNHINVEFMRQSARALVFPYASPHIQKFAEDWIQVIRSATPTTAGSEPSVVDLAAGIQSNKQNVVFVDNDAGFNWPPVDASLYSIQVASGFSPDKLYQRYSEVRVSVDFNVRGGERFVYESGLFGVCTLVDNDRNGLNRGDFPIPEILRVGKHNNRKDFMDDANSRVKACLTWAENDKKKVKGPIGVTVSNTHNNTSPAPLDGIDPTKMTLWEAYQPFRTHVALQRSNMERQVRRYFSNSVHILTVVLNEEDAQERLVPFIIATLFQMPFATIEVVFASQYLRSLVPASLLKTMHTMSLLSAVTLTVLSIEGDESEQQPNVATGTPGATGGDDSAASTPTGDAWVGVAEDLRATVEVLLERRRRSVAPPRAPSPRSVAPHTSPLMSLYTCVLPLSAATGNEGDFVHYLGSMLTLISTAPSSSSSSSSVTPCKAKDALDSSKLNTELSLLNPEYHRHHLRALNHLSTTSAEGWFSLREHVLKHLENGNLSRGLVDEDDDQGQHSLNHLTKLLMQKRMKHSMLHDTLVRPACGRRYSDKSGAAVISTAAGESAGSVLGLLWRTSEEPTASAALAEMVHWAQEEAEREGGGEKRATSEVLRVPPAGGGFFTPIANTLETLPRVPERTLFQKTATPYTNFTEGGPLVRVTSSLIVPMRNVVSAEAMFLGSGHFPVATLPSLRHEPFLGPESSIRSFLCEHEVWRLLVDRRRTNAYHSPQHTECPNAVGYEPLIDNFLEKSLAQHTPASDLPIRTRRTRRGTAFPRFDVSRFRIPPQKTRR